MSAGALREKVAFDLRSEVPDGAGNYEDAWGQVGQPVAAQIRFLKGSEPVVAQRLEGHQPAVITVRSSAATRAITTNHRIRDIRTGRTFNITAPAPDERKAYIDFLCMAGGADG